MQIRKLPNIVFLKANTNIPKSAIKAAIVIQWEKQTCLVRSFNHYIKNNASLILHETFKFGGK